MKHHLKDSSYDTPNALMNSAEKLKNCLQASPYLRRVIQSLFVAKKIANIPLEGLNRFTDPRLSTIVYKSVSIELSNNLQRVCVLQVLDTLEKCKTMTLRWGCLQWPWDHILRKCECHSDHTVNCTCESRILSCSKQKAICDTLAKFAAARTTNWSREVLKDMFVDPTGNVVVFTDKTNLGSSSYRAALSSIYADLPAVRAPTIYVHLVPEQQQWKYGYPLEEVLSVEHRYWTNGKQSNFIETVEPFSHNLIIVVPTKKFRELTCPITDIGIDCEDISRGINRAIWIKLLWIDSTADIDYGPVSAIYDGDAYKVKAKRHCLGQFHSEIWSCEAVFSFSKCGDSRDTETRSFAYTQ